MELPAGIVDKGTFKGAAASEIEEELINVSKLALPESKKGGDAISSFPSFYMRGGFRGSS